MTDELKGNLPNVRFTRKHIARNTAQSSLKAVPWIGEAIAYALGNWAALLRYTEDGDLEIDNNGAERSLRGVAVGRKNWVFFGSDTGGRTAAILTSFLTTCKLLHIDPFVYLRDVFDRISAHPASRLAELLPDQWKAARTTATPPDVQPAPLRTRDKPRAILIWVGRTVTALPRRAGDRADRSEAGPARRPEGEAPRRSLRWLQRDRRAGAESAPGRVGGLAERGPVRPAADGWAPAAAALSNGAPAWKTSSFPGSRQRDTTTWRPHWGPPRDTGTPLPLSSARTRPGGSLGRRGDRMAPLR